ncbi:unnamed protein product [Brassica oleracea var. botrytis]|uniref:Uncharacterized protein n=1 Tax=Brassica oleracea TaxID=3712 RepID=A0A3P6EIQ7_BRAOL|nr:unnamed protein product [Brassica oleracea]
MTSNGGKHEMSSLRSSGDSIDRATFFGHFSDVSCFFRRALLDEQCEDESDTDSGDIQHTQVHETQEDEKVYRVTIYDDTHISNEYTHETTQNHVRRGQQQGRLNAQSTVDVVAAPTD